MPDLDRKNIGFLAEGLAAKSLESRGYTILDHNYRKPWGEIDIIAEKQEILIFVEVKANSTHREGFAPEIRAGNEKLRKVLRTAKTYMMDKRYSADQPWQIDIISVTFNKSTRTAQIKHFKNVTG